MKPLYQLLAEIKVKEFWIFPGVEAWQRDEVVMNPSFKKDYHYHVIDRASYDKLKAVAVELANGLEFAIQDVSTGHWEDACKVPPNYELCDHCWLIAHLTAARKLMEDE